MTEIYETSHEDNSLARRKEYILLAEKLRQYPEPIPFPGIEDEWYAKLKKDDEAFPGFTTPTDEILSRMKTEGIKVAFGKHPDSGNVFILPYLSTIEDIETDMLFPYHLTIADGLDEDLKALILSSKTRHQESSKEGF